MFLKELIFVALISSFCLISQAHGDLNVRKDLIISSKNNPRDNESQKTLIANIPDDPKLLRDLIQKIDLPKVTPPKTLEELNLIKENLLKSSPAKPFSVSLEEMLKDLTTSGSSVMASAPVLGIVASEAIADPNINIIDSHVSELIKTNDHNFQPDFNEMKKMVYQKHKSSNVHNLLRENLLIQSIKEEETFKLGFGVDLWKVITISFEKTALIGRANTSIIVAIGHGNSYEQLTSLHFDIHLEKPFLFETLKIFDSKLDRARNLVLVALQGQLIWHELIENNLVEIHRWNLLKEIDSIIHFTHDGSEILLLSTIDEAGKVQAEFIEFNLPESEFWVIQAFTLTERSPSMICLDLGGDVIAAFVQTNSVSIYRHQFTKHLRGKFVHFKTIKAAGVGVVSGFRIGGHSYLAIGGDQPQILRYFNGDFYQQTILSQTFGHVEEFLPIPIRTYRDDLVLLVQHRLEFPSHTLAVVDALVWNGIAFENAMSVPCHLVHDANANGFTCMLDPERDDGFLGAAYIHHEKENSLYILVPMIDAQSELFRVNYALVEAEDPLIKEMEQIKKSIELINQMLDYEESVKKEIDEALKSAMDPKNDFIIDGLTWVDELDTDFLELDGNVELENNVVEFADTTWTQEDFLVNLDQLEAMIAADEQKLKMIDEELSKLNRINRQASDEEQSQDSPVINIGAYSFNGNIEPKTIKSLPSEHVRPPRDRDQDQSVRNIGSHTINGQLDPKTIQTLPAGNQRQPRQVKPIEESKAQTLNVKNLVVGKINGIPFSELIFLENGQLIVPSGNISFRGFVEAENVNMLNNGRVNGIDFSHDILAVDSPNPTKQLLMENIVVQNLEIQKLNNIPVDLASLQAIDAPSEIQTNLTARNVIIRNNLNVESINGISWDEFVSKLVPKHLTSSINEITVDGDVWVIDTGVLNAEFLNQLPFPHGYVLSNGPQNTVITGRKTFVGEVVTTAIDTNGEIDGVKPSNMISLDQPQNISAETTFRSLEVIRKLEVNGTIAGKKLHEFLPNPTLAETNQILSACNFRELIVEGKLTIEDSLNSQKLDSVLADVVYELPEDVEVVINAPKSFIDLEVKGDVEISKNLINDVKLDNIMLTDRDQKVNFNRISGDVFIADLKLTGLFDGINATELEHNSFRTFGDQFIETPIIVHAGRRVEAASSDITTTLNGIPVSKFVFIDQTVKLVNNVLFNELNAENVVLNGDIDGPGTFKSLNASDLSSIYLSKSRIQEIRAPTKINSLTTNGVFFTRKINEYDFEVFRKYMHGIRNFKTLILSGEQKLDKLIIDGNVKINFINGKDFNQIVENVVWLNRPNAIAGNLKFLDDVLVEGSLTVQENLNRKLFKSFVDNWISNQEKSIKINSDKVFNKNVMVEVALETRNINDIAFDNLLMLKDSESLRSLNIHGNINVEKLTVSGAFNEKLTDFHNVYSYDALSDTHIVSTKVHFNQPSVVNFLNSSLINQINVSVLMQNLIKTDESDVLITSEKIFANQFLAQQGFHADSINDIRLDFLDEVVLANEPVLKIVNGDLEFTGDVYAKLIGIKGDLYTRFISSCDTKEWIRLSLPIDKDVELNGVMYINASSFKPKNLEALKLNGLPLAKLFTLTTNQTFDHEIKVLGCLEVEQPLFVKGPVNGFSIEQERANTVMLNEKHQVVTVKTSFGGARVFGPLTTQAKVNSKDLRNIVMVNSSPTIESALIFKSLQGTSLNTNNLISSTNFDRWYDNVLWNKEKSVQTVSGKWRVKKLRVVDDVSGNGLINDVSISEIENNLKNSINAIDAAISDQGGKYQELCHVLGVKANNSKSSIHILKYFEMDFKLKEPLEIFSFFTFRTPLKQDFILVNTNCTTQVYKWQREIGRFKLFTQIITGVVYDWAIVKNLKNDVFIIANSRMEADYPCPIGGLNVWKMNEDQIFHVNTIPTDSVVLELHVIPQIPGRFFTLNEVDSVEHFDVFGEKKEFWELPKDNHNYSFVPSEIISDLTMFNGQKLFNLDSKFKKRQTRFLFDGLNKRNNERNQVQFAPNFGFNPTVSMLPSIPSKPFVQNEADDQDGKENFVSKLQQINDAVKQSLSDTFSKVSKLTIKNASNVTSVGDNKPIADSETKKAARTKEEVEASRQKSSKDETVTFAGDSTISKQTATTTTLSASTSTKRPNAMTETERQKIVPSQSRSENSSSATEEQIPEGADNVGGIIDKLKHVAEGIRKTFSNMKLASTLMSPGNQTHETLSNVSSRGDIANSSGDPIELAAEISTSSEPNKATETSTSTPPSSTSTTSLLTNPSSTSTESSTVSISSTSTATSDESIKTSLEDVLSEMITEITGDVENNIQEVSEASESSLPEKVPITTVPTDTISSGSTEDFRGVPVIAITPKIILPPSSDDENFLEFEFPAETTKFPEVTVAAAGELEQQVPHEVLTGSGLSETENTYFPEHGTGEFVMMFVGPWQKKRVLYAVTRNRDSTIKGNHNIIEIYNDIFEGSIYQYILCSDPSNLAVLQFRDETLLAFLENRSEINVFIYRGIQGFVAFKRIKLPSYASQMTSITLPPKIDYKCDRHYLVVRTETELIFYGVKISGNCGIDDVNCDAY